MREQWKPGDVGLLDGFPVLRTAKGWLLVTGNPGVRFSECLDVEGQPDEARPLVVIDPEDREQVQRLRDFYLDEGVPRLRWQVDHMQAALRSLLKPAKPDEPKGRYAAVMDQDGNEWVRLGMGPAPWMFNGSPGNRDTYPWSEVSAVKVLSDGVPHVCSECGLPGSAFGEGGWIQNHADGCGASQ